MPKKLGHLAGAFMGLVFKLIEKPPRLGVKGVS
jgi:hypothetical protein